MFFNFFENDYNDRIISSFSSSYKENKNDILFNEESFCFGKENKWMEEKSNIFSGNINQSFEEKELPFDTLAKIQNEEDLYYQNIQKEKICEETEKEGSTRPNSDKKGENQIKKTSKDKFKTERKNSKNLPTYWRMDMTKKHWKTQISNYAKDKINKLIEESDLPKELKQPIHSPNSLKFTANTTVTANAKFLKFNLIEVFTIGKENEKLQKQNDENITKIFEYFNREENFILSESQRKIKEFFEMSYEDLIKNFYDSYEFIDFKNDEKTIFYDDGIIKQEKYSLLKKYKLIDLFGDLKKKKKKKRLKDILYVKACY